MSGHSKWSTIKHQKAAKDAKRGKVFSKLSMQIALAAKESADLSMNPTLRLVVADAKRVGMPKESIERAIARGSGKAGEEELKEAIYEAYGIGGAAMVIKTITDNQNRTISEIRSILNKNGGKLAGQGAVAYQFSQAGEVVIENKNISDKDELQLELIDQGVDDWIEEGDNIIIYTKTQDLMRVSEFLINKGAIINSQKTILKPATFLALNNELVEKNRTILEKLEELDDVQEVFVNF